MRPVASVPSRREHHSDTGTVASPSPDEQEGVIVLHMILALIFSKEGLMLAILKAASWIGLFCLLAYAGLKIVFMAICILGGHNSVEAMFSVTTPVILGAAIGMETFFWFRNARHIGRP